MSGFLNPTLLYDSSFYTQFYEVHFHFISFILFHIMLNERPLSIRPTLDGQLSHFQVLENLDFDKTDQDSDGRTDTV